MLKVSTATQQEPESNQSAGDFMDMRERNRTLEAIAGFAEKVFGVAPASGEPILLEVA